MSDNMVLCPFYRPSGKSFTMRLCNHLRAGVPLCIVSGFFEGWDEEFEQARMLMSDAELRTKFPEHFVHVEYCASVIRSDVYLAFRPEFKKGGCFFGGLCVCPAAWGYSGCSVDCSRWKG
jgi:hypothetical protein